MGSVLWPVPVFYGKVGPRRSCLLFITLILSSVVPFKARRRGLKWCSLEGLRGEKSREGTQGSMFSLLSCCHLSEADHCICLKLQ